jgi:hypothetical protein
MGNVHRQGITGYMYSTLKGETVTCQLKLSFTRSFALSQEEKKTVRAVHTRTTRGMRKDATIAKLLMRTVMIKSRSH